jgi:hypothetical protein
MRFSLLGMPALRTRYLSYVGIERIIHNLLFRIIRIYDNMLFVELGQTDFQITCNGTYFPIFE